MKKVIVISAHPDDETLGVGGTLLRHADHGDEIYWIIVTDIFEKDGVSAQRVIERSDEIEKVSSLYGFTKIFNLGYSSAKLDTTHIPDLVKSISKIFNEVEPEVIYSLNRSDAHSDHRIIFDATMACTKSFRYPSIKQLLMYECISETEFAPSLNEKVFIPNYFVDITDYIDKKIDIMKVFKSELAPAPFPRSIENIRALATFRGCSVGVNAAESFQLLKYIDK